jgi:hypothetical protein
LIVCPSHRPGLFGLIYFFIVIFYQPNINGTYEQKEYKTNLPFFNYPLNVKKGDSSTIKLDKLEHPVLSHFSNNYITNKYTFKIVKSGLEYTIFYQFTFGIFIMCVFYTTTFLPYGRFYNRLGGNVGMLTSYLYIFFYLGSSILKRN